MAGDITLYHLTSRYLVQSLVAKVWARRGKGRIVIAANDGFIPGAVSMNARAGDNIDLIRQLQELGLARETIVYSREGGADITVALGEYHSLLERIGFVGSAGDENRSEGPPRM